MKAAKRLLTKAVPLASVPLGAISNGTALFRDYVAYDLAAALQAARVPVRSINADFWPTNVTANGKYADFDAAILDGYGHFLMQEQPDAVLAALRSALG